MVMAAEKPAETGDKPPKRFMSADDVALELDVTVTTVRRWLRTGVLTGSLLSRQAGWRIAREDLERFLRERRPDQDS